MESSAMFFAAAYITKEMSGKTRTDKIVKYLKSKGFTPPKGKFYSGNEVILSAYSKNNYDLKKTLKQILNPSGAVKIMKERAGSPATL
ncbi:MAG: hypothetical protein ACP5T6_00230 [Candidatus Micrarchaeia archaeon]